VNYFLRCKAVAVLGHGPAQTTLARINKPGYGLLGSFLRAVDWTHGLAVGLNHPVIVDWFRKYPRAFGGNRALKSAMASMGLFGYHLTAKYL
jgi:hypothetical protein